MAAGGESSSSGQIGAGVAQSYSLVQFALKLKGTLSK